MIFGTLVFVLVRSSKYFCYFTRCFIGGRCSSLLSSLFELLLNLSILILSMHIRWFSLVRYRDWVFLSCSSWFLIASGHRIACFTIFSAHLYPADVLEPGVLEYTENKKGTVPNLKRFRILKRIRNLFGFRTKPVRYKTHFRKSRKQVPQKSFYTTDATENGFSRYGTIITSVSLQILC